MWSHEKKNYRCGVTKKKIADIRLRKKIVDVVPRKKKLSMWRHEKSALKAHENAFKLHIFQVST